MYKGEMIIRGASLSKTEILPVQISEKTVGIATIVHVNCCSNEDRKCSAEANTIKNQSQGTCKFTLNFSFVSALQSKGYGGLAGEMTISFLELLEAHSFLQIFTKLVAVLGFNQVNIKEKFQNEALGLEKMTQKKNI